MKIDKDLVAFITGASSGFGWIIASDLLRAGARCYLTDRNTQAVAFTKQYPDRCIFTQMDIIDEVNVKAAFDDCASKFSYISVVINSAGIATPNFSILTPECNVQNLKNILNVNVVGSINVSKYAALQFVKQTKTDKEKKDYLIVNFGSAASTHALEGMTLYAASKGAVFAMTLPLARDLGKFGIRVLIITPGFFKTPMGMSAPPEVLAKYQKQNALGRHGEPEELSAAVLGAIECSFFTGTFFHMDSTFASPHL